MRVSDCAAYALLCLLVAVLVWIYMVGDRGMVHVWYQEGRLSCLRMQVMCAQRRLAWYEAQQKAWQEDPFYMEQVARQELQLGYPGEHVYITS